ncbi:MAG: thymidine kinase [Flavobacteriaceae bacterium]|nr:thymidine kinase [Flavobacteriaceae bacterium]|tara:strand:+ start:754 stop:1344 length:591 start_codon:yes stop_codon:yes gene_type:complete
MFLENTLNFDKQTGWIEVVCGSMFSGKTEELIRRIRRAQYANLNVTIFKPTLDTRDKKNTVVSHDETTIDCKTIKRASEIYKLSKTCRVVGIDEAQFFDDEIVEVCNSLANHGVRVIVAGLDMDYKGVPFKNMANLMATSEYVTKVHAICPKTGGLAQYSYRKTKSKKRILLGKGDEYMPLSRAAYFKKKNKKSKD